jgi:hypothetical protein
MCKSLGIRDLCVRILPSKQKGNKMIDKQQRLDAYVQAAMGALSGDIYLLTRAHISKGHEKIYNFAKGMMDYVDAHQAEVKPREAAEGWLSNTGSMPVQEGVEVEVRFRGGEEYTDTAEAFYWDDTGGVGCITHWRVAQ